MRQRRTDLALEAKELWEESARQTAKLEGVTAFTETREGFLTETVEILDERGEKALGKPAGRYVTLTMDGLARREEGAFPRAARAVGGELARLMDGVPGRGLVLVVGLGNRAITPDAIGPKVHEHTLVTRHLVEQIPEHFGAFRPVASLSAGVLGTTGMESGELVQAVCRRLKPACVVAVDALASPPAPGWAITGGPWTGPPWVCRCWRWECPRWWTRPPWRPTCWGRRSCPLWERGGTCWSPPRTSTARWTIWPKSSAMESAWRSSRGWM